MTPRALKAQTKKLRKIAEFAFGDTPHVSVDLSCDVYSYKWAEPSTTYRVYIGSPGHASYETRDWKDVLSLITWLEDVEATVSFRTR